MPGAGQEMASELKSPKTEEKVMNRGICNRKTCYKKNAGKLAGLHLASPSVPFL